MSTFVDIAPCRRIEGAIRVPGDKSISHRALLVTAMSEGSAMVTGLSPAQDVASTARALARLGATNSQDNSQVEKLRTSSGTRDLQIQVQGTAGRFEEPQGPVDVGNSGSTIRMLLGLLAGSSISAELTGDASILRRPMGRVVGPLRLMGAQIEGRENGEFAPLLIQGRPLHGYDHVLPVASAQVKSALLLAGLRANGETRVSEPSPSRDHTERMLKYLGVPIVQSLNSLSIKSIKIQAADLDVPGDLSSAAFLLVAAAILPDSDLTITGVGLNPTRTGILSILRQFGAQVTVSDEQEVCGEPRGSVRVRSGDRRAVEVAGPLVVDAIDELPLVAVLGAVAEGETVLRDASELRVKESDRIAAIAEGLRRLGADIRDTPDGFVVRGPARLRGAEANSAGDHRIAMALAVAALAAEGTTRITGWDAVGVSYPGFEHDLGLVVVP